MNTNAPGVKRLRAELLAEDPHCRYCGCPLSHSQASAEHRVPRSRGGATTRENITLSCRRCNRWKGSRTPAEFAELLRRILERLEA